MAKKKKRRRPHPPGIDPNEKRRQRLEEKRRQREEAEKAKRRAEFRERLVRGVVLAGLAVAALWFFFGRNLTPAEIQGHQIEKFGESGGHTDQTVAYPMTPPVSGQHFQAAAPCGVHAEQIQDELFVHSLEHGTVAVLYDPEQVETPTIRDIEALVDEFNERTISAPYAGMETPITVASWAEMMRLPDYDEGAIREYIDEFIGKGPEDLRCDNDRDTPFEPQATEAPPTPAASPDDG
jgi:formylglycine-generating enzyme required for sulfatase activity